MSAPDNYTTGQPVHSHEIDLMEYIKIFWKRRYFILKVCGLSAVVGLIIALSKPKEYTATIKLAPEINAQNTTSNLGAIAGLAGIDLGMTNGQEALSPDLYPDIVQSTPFQVALFQVPVTELQHDTVTLYNYLHNHQKQAWWVTILGLPHRLINWTTSIFAKQEASDTTHIPNPTKLTKQEFRVVDNLMQRIQITVDKKIGTTTLSVTMQDPEIAAAIADTVMNNLQAYITEYRTNKARKDLEFAIQLYNVAKNDYYNAQQQYAELADRNKALITQSNQTYLERLRNERDLAFGVYNQTAQQLALAKAKVQEITPVFTVVEPASVPLQPSGISKMMILIGFILLGGAVSILWIVLQHLLSLDKKNISQARQS